MQGRVEDDELMKDIPFYPSSEQGKNRPPFLFGHMWRVEDRGLDDRVMHSGWVVGPGGFSIFSLQVGIHRET